MPGATSRAPGMRDSEPVSAAHALLGPVLGLLLAACGASEPAVSPSVILVSLDTLRADHLGLYGYARDTSPGLDRLAAESLVFEHAFTTAAWTLPAHMSMLTGLHNPQHGVVERHAALSPETPLLAERLRAQGYRTIGLYNVSPIRPEHGFGRGFDVFRSHTSAAEAERHLEEELARLDPERPFFLFLHLFDVHNGPLGDQPGPIYDCPPPYDEKFLPGAKERLPKLPERVVFERGLVLGAEEQAALEALYDGGIRYVDDELSAWMEEWRARGLLAHALLVVTADHGESLGQHGAVHGHGGPYQEGLRVPLLLRHPGGLRAGEREATPVQLTDLVPTILAFVGLPPDPRLPGVSLLGALPARRELLASEPGKYESIVDWPVKWTHVLGEAERWFRHDLAADPGEAVELSLSPAEFQAKQADIRRRTPARFPRPVRVEWSGEELERMRGLGYGLFSGGSEESGGAPAEEKEGAGG
jgi:arylsulfatase A-like enzyme